MVGASGPASTSAHHVFDDWMVQRGMEASATSARALFGELCARFFEINLRMLRLGMLAEVHGQNAVLVVRQGRVEGLLLRDHDSLRINVGQLERHGMQDPCYRIKPGHANTLYHDSQEALVFWLQTLAIQVNLRARLPEARIKAAPSVRGTQFALDLTLFSEAQADPEGEGS